MAAPYIPPKDADLATFSENYATLVTATPSAFGLSGPDVAAINSANDTFQAAYLVITNPATKSVTTVNDKNSAKQALIGIIRTYSAQIRLNPGVTNANKLALGLNLPNNSPTPVPPPVTTPLLAVVGQISGSLTLRYSDSTTPDKRAKPAGAAQLELWLAQGTAAVTDPLLCTKWLSTTKQPAVITFTSGTAGKVYTVFGRWVTRTGLVGAWGASVTGTIT